jgi:hypothetical protein
MTKLNAAALTLRRRKFSLRDLQRLAFVPYLLMRGPVTRIVNWWRGGASGEIR